MTDNKSPLDDNEEIVTVEEDDEDEVDDDDDEDEDEEDDLPYDVADCPICNERVTFDGGCSHLAFIFEFVNFDYMYLNSNYESVVIQHLSNLGYVLENLPCPSEGWASDDEGNPIPGIETLVPGLVIIEDMHLGNHDGWGYIWGFMKTMEIKDSNDETTDFK